MEEFIPEYLDKEPAAFMGLSMSELVGLVVKSFSFTFPILSLLLIALTGNVAFIAISIILSIGLSVLYTKYRAGKIREESKGKPSSHSKHAFQIKFELFKRKHSDFFRTTKFYHTIPDGLWGR